MKIGLRRIRARNEIIISSHLLNTCLYIFLNTDYRYTLIKLNFPLSAGICQVSLFHWLLPSINRGPSCVTATSQPTDLTSGTIKAAFFTATTILAQWGI